MKDKNHHFRDLQCWQKGRELKQELYKIARKLPDIEKYNLQTQIMRAAVSITANIAEGYGRFHFKENIQYCRQSRASVYECEDHIITCLDQNYISKDEYQQCISLIIETRKLLDGYIRFLQKESSKHKDESRD